MPIFISHTSKDDEIAQRVFYYLNYIHNTACYIDDMDRMLNDYKGKSELTPLLVEKLRNCDTLLAIVTENTKESWWVPFEIGTAREMPRAILSYTTLPDHSTNTNQEKLPEYLLEWPRLRKDDSSLDILAQKYNRQVPLREGEYGYEDFSIRSDLIDNPRNFELSLMESLGQRSY